MASPDLTSNQKKIILVSNDPSMVKMTKGSIPSNDEQLFVVVEKKVTDLGGEVREFMCHALILDIDATSVADFEQLQKIKRMVGNNCPIIIVSEKFSAAAARILIQLKVADFLTKPMQTSEIVRALNNALKTTGEETQVEPQFLSFMPASGGVGSTVLALESAAILNKYGQKFGRTTCLVDLNFQNGSCAEYLDIEPRFDIAEIENAPERLDRQLLDVMLSKHPSGLSIIAAPNTPSEMRTFKPALVIKLLDLVSAYFDYVVIDVPRIWLPWTETVLMGSNRVFIVADMTVPSIRHARRLSSAIIEKAGKNTDPKIIVNRMDQRKNSAGLNASDVTAALGDSFIGSIPNNYMLVRNAVDRGVQLSEIEPANNVTKALSAIILKSEAEDAQRPVIKSNLFTPVKNLFTRKAG